MALRPILRFLGYPDDAYDLSADGERIRVWRGPGTPPSAAQLAAGQAAFAASPAGAAEGRRVAAAASLQGARAAIRTDIAEAQADRDLVAGADLATLRTLLRRTIVRQLAALRRERHALYVAGLDGDDGEA